MDPAQNVAQPGQNQQQEHPQQHPQHQGQGAIPPHQLLDEHYVAPWSVASVNQAMSAGSAGPASVFAGITIGGQGAAGQGQDQSLAAAAAQLYGPGPQDIAFAGAEDPIVPGENFAPGADAVGEGAGAGGGAADDLFNLDFGVDGEEIDVGEFDLGMGGGGVGGNDNEVGFGGGDIFGQMNGGGGGGGAVEGAEDIGVGNDDTQLMRDVCTGTRERHPPHPTAAAASALAGQDLTPAAAGPSTEGTGQGAAPGGGHNQGVQGNLFSPPTTTHDPTPNQQGLVPVVTPISPATTTAGENEVSQSEGQEPGLGEDQAGEGEQAQGQVAAGNAPAGLEDGFAVDQAGGEHGDGVGGVGGGVGGGGAGVVAVVQAAGGGWGEEVEEFGGGGGAGEGEGAAGNGGNGNGIGPHGQVGDDAEVLAVGPAEHGDEAHEIIDVDAPIGDVIEIANDEEADANQDAIDIDGPEAGEVIEISDDEEPLLVQADAGLDEAPVAYWPQDLIQYAQDGEINIDNLPPHLQPEHPAPGGAAAHDRMGALKALGPVGCLQWSLESPRVRPIQGKPWPLMGDNDIFPLPAHIPNTAIARQRHLSIQKKRISKHFEVSDHQLARFVDLSTWQWAEELRNDGADVHAACVQITGIPLA